MRLSRRLSNPYRTYFKGVSLQFNVSGLIEAGDSSVAAPFTRFTVFLYSTSVLIVHAMRLSGNGETIIDQLP